jgi:hypothetical protein
MSYDNDFAKDQKDTTVVNMIRAPHMPDQLREAMDRMMII